MAEQEPSDLVVIGSSAGGIDALITLVTSLPPDFPAPIVIAQHLDPARPSHLEQILGRRSALPVRTVVDREKLAPGEILVVPADRDVAVNDHELSLRARPRDGPKPSVDLLFSSASRTFGEQLIAVILTGLGSDGAAGARVVSAGGGTVIIQNPATASYPSMPLSLAPNTVDVVADLEAIGPLLVEILAGTYAPTRDDEERVLRAFLDDLRQRSGIDFASYRRGTIIRRLQRRMVATGSTGLRDYIRYLHRHPEEYQRLTSSFLIKVTEFYRDADLFELLRTSIVPDIVRDAVASGREMRVWSAGCATGEEAYSLAILVHEALSETAASTQARIFATDLDNEAIAFARRGIYPSSALAGLDPETRERHFVDRGGEFEIRKHLRAMTVFGQHDLARRAPFPRIDLVLCRNVLIYFTPDLQRRALQLFAFSLREGGYLVLGKAETSRPLPEYYTLADSKLKVYRRQGERVVVPEVGKVALHLDGPVASLPSRVPRPNRRAVPRHMKDLDAPPIPRAESAFFDLPIGVVVLDADYDIVSINGAARRLLGIHGPAIGGDLLHQAHVPADPLRRAIEDAARGHTTVRMTVSVSPDESPTGNALALELSAYPTNPSSDGRVKSIVLTIAETPKPAAGPERVRGVDVSAAGTTQLERLQKTNDVLQTANLDLLQANSALTAENEELYAANEEVQAATEEVETLNEELQASNEELETLNEELQATVEELNTTNDDLHARSVELQELAVTLEEQRQLSETGRERLETILANMSDAVLVVTRDGSRLLSNAAYDKLFAGPLTMVDAAGESLPSDETPEALAAKGKPFTVPFRVVEASGSVRWFEAKGRPITIDGRRAAIVQFRDISERSLRLLHEEFVALATHELRTPLTALHAYVQLLSRRPEIRQHPQLAAYVDTALGESKRLAGLITELTEATRLQGGRLELEREPVDLGRVVARVVDIAQALTEKQAIRFEPTKPIVISGDADRLEQVILNLISNAITHAPRSRFIDVALRRAGRDAELRVSDQGPGVPKADLPHLFSRFYQVSRKQGGTEQGLGLGLYISREIVRAHGGEISVTSTEGKGTTFSVRLPLASRHESEAFAEAKEPRAIRVRPAPSVDGRSPANNTARLQATERTSDGRRRSNLKASAPRRCTTRAVRKRG